MVICSLHRAQAPRQGPWVGAHSSIFTLSSLLPDVNSSCAICPCVTMGKPAPRGRDVLVCGHRGATFPPSQGLSCDANTSWSWSLIAPGASPKPTLRGTAPSPEPEGVRRGARTGPRGDGSHRALPPQAIHPHAPRSSLPTSHFSSSTSRGCCNSSMPLE